MPGQAEIGGEKITGVGKGCVLRKKKEADGLVLGCHPRKLVKDRSSTTREGKRLTCRYFCLAGGGRERGGEVGDPYLPTQRRELGFGHQVRVTRSFFFFLVPGWRGNDPWEGSLDGGAIAAVLGHAKRKTIFFFSTRSLDS